MYTWLHRYCRLPAHTHSMPAPFILTTPLSSSLNQTLFMYMRSSHRLILLWFYEQMTSSFDRQRWWCLVVFSLLQREVISTHRWEATATLKSFWRGLRLWMWIFRWGYVHVDYAHAIHGILLFFMSFTTNCCTYVKQTTCFLDGQSMDVGGLFVLNFNRTRNETRFLGSLYKSDSQGKNIIVYINRAMSLMLCPTHTYTSYMHTYV